MIHREIQQYQTVRGKVPFREWLLGLRDVQARARIRARLDRLALGNLGDTKSLGGGIFELRFHFGPGWRVYFGEDRKVLVILLCGGDKGSQAGDIERARKYWKDYLGRTYESKP